MRATTKRDRDLLNDAFPYQSLRLIAFIKRQNARLHQLPKWRVRQLQNLIDALNRTAFELDRAWEEKRLTTLAWAARNFLELSVWVDYCCASEENATRFREDTSRDMYGMVAAAKKGDITPELGQKVDLVLQRFERIFNKPTFKVTDGYKRVLAAAGEVGREAEFLSCNKLLSKLAHPTAFVVNSRPVRKMDNTLRAACFMMGVRLGLQGMVRLTDFLFAHFPDPRSKKQSNSSHP